MPKYDVTIKLNPIHLYDIEGNDEREVRENAIIFLLEHQSLLPCPHTEPHKFKIVPLDQRVDTEDNPKVLDTRGEV